MSLHVDVFPPYYILFCPYIITEICLKKQEKKRMFVIVMGYPQSFFNFQKSFYYARMKNGGTFKFIKKNNPLH